jgi:aconitate hydratase
MGVLPLQFTAGTNRNTLALQGTETYNILGISQGLEPRQMLRLQITRATGEKVSTDILCRIDTLDELDYFRNGGILPYVLRSLLK